MRFVYYALLATLALAVAGCPGGSLVLDDDATDDDGGDDDGGDDDGGDDDGGDDDGGDDDGGDDDTGDDDGGDDDTGNNPLIGAIYVQNGGVGYASYHFDAVNDVYISYQNFPGAYLDNGQPFPNKKPFTNRVFDIPQRTFEATVDWSSPENTTVSGAERWEYEMIFSPNYSTISGGQVKAFAPNGTHLTTYYFGSDLIYSLY